MATKGILYYTDNRLDPVILNACQRQLDKIQLPIISVSLQPMAFGENYVVPLKRSYLTMFKQILTGLQMASFDIVFMCFQGDTHIETDHGQKRIDKIVVGDLVKTHLGRYRPVRKVFITPYKQRKPIIQIDTQFNSVRCTPDHPFYVYTDNEKKWIMAKDLKEQDVLLYPSKKTEDYIDFNISLKSSTSNGGYGKMDVNIKRLKVDIELARFMGMYLAEGHYNGKNGIGALFKKWFGDNARNKRIPNFVFDWNIKNRLAFIKGFLEGDGSKSRQGDSYFTFVVASKRLVEDMIILMNSAGVGWDNEIRSRVNMGTYAYSRGKMYSVDLSRKVYRKLKDILYSEYIDDDYIGIPIKATSKSGISNQGFVYNLEVAEDNSFIANSVIVHNCEHDVLYAPEHFQFTPHRNDTYYYNRNNHKVRYPDGQALFYNCEQTLGLCGDRQLLLEHYMERVYRVETQGFTRKMGFEPGKHKLPTGIDNNPWDWYMSKYPNIDIRHGQNLTESRWTQEEFRSQKNCTGWLLSDNVPGWGQTKGNFVKLLEGI